MNEGPRPGAAGGARSSRRPFASTLASPVRRRGRYTYVAAYVLAVTITSRANVYIFRRLQTRKTGDNIGFLVETVDNEEHDRP